MSHTLSVYGQSLLAYEQGDTNATLDIIDETGSVTSIPVAAFFRQPEDFFPLEQTALQQCRGHILDIGAGAGIHSLWLQQRHHPVTAIDLSLEAVDIMKRAGVKDARHADIWTIQGEHFDTLLMLGRNIGIAGTLEGADKLLTHLHQLTSPGGQLMIVSLAPEKLGDGAGYPGEHRYRERFQGQEGPPFRWLNIDADTLCAIAHRSGWQTDIVSQQADGHYLARLFTR